MDDRSDDALETRVVRVRGLVQGVGYRHACLEQAQKLNITGWVRNRVDGSVEAMLQGTPPQLTRMCHWMRHEVPTAVVTDIEITEAPTPLPGFPRFEQWPTL